jgi:hypothetical protein
VIDGVEIAVGLDDFSQYDLGHCGFFSPYESEG